MKEVTLKKSKAFKALNIFIFLFINLTSALITIITTYEIIEYGPYPTAVLTLAMAMGILVLKNIVQCVNPEKRATNNSETNSKVCGIIHQLQHLEDNKIDDTYLERIKEMQMRMDKLAYKQFTDGIVETSKDNMEAVETG